MSVGTLLRRKAALAVIATVAALVVGLTAAVAVFGVAAGTSIANWNTIAGGGSAGFDATTFTPDNNYYTEEDQFTGGSKDILDPDTGWYWRAVGQVPDKTDLLAAATAYRASNKTIYFAADRYATNGDAKIGFWFLQGDVSRNDDGSFDGSHVDGDILVEATFTQGGAVSDVKVWQWEGGSLGDAPIALGGDCDSGSVGSFIACGDVNEGPESGLTHWDYEGKFSTGTLPAGAFFSGAVDLSRIYPGAIPCFGTTIAESRSAGSSITSELKDLIISPFSTCADITVQKVRQGGTAADTFDFTTGGTLTPDTFELTGATSAGTVGAGNARTFEDLQPGTYRVTELAPDAPWELASLACTGGSAATNVGTRTATITAAAGQHIVCTFTNRRAPELKVVKELVPADDSGRFDLKIDGTTYKTSASDGDSTGFQVVSAGNHSVSEGATADTGTDLTAYTTTITCRSAGGSVIKSGNGTTLTGIGLTYGDRVTCTIRNTKLAEIRVVKELTPSDDEGRFDLKIDGTTYATSVSDGGSTEFIRVSAGNHTVSEAGAGGTLLSDYRSEITCEDGQHGSGTSLSVSVSAGDQLVCTIHNVRITPTRTQGYWQTHWALTTAVWDGEKGSMTSGDRTLCGIEVTATDGTGQSQLLGGFWAGIARDVDGVKRERIDQARMSLLQQLLAALLNRAYFGTNEETSASIDAAKAALCTDDIDAINTSQGEMGEYNSSGDGASMPKEDSASAEPNRSQELANVSFWDAFLAALPRLPL